MFISICRRVLEVVEAEAEVVEDEEWEEEEALVWDTEEEDGLDTEVEDGAEEDIMAAQEEVFSTIQPISKITTHLMYTFIQRRPPM